MTLKRILAAAFVAAAITAGSARVAAANLPADPPAGGDTECTTTIYWYWDPYWGPVFLWAEKTCVTIID